MITDHARLADLRKAYPAKFAPEQDVFANVHPGDHIFVGTGCGEPQYLIQALISYVQTHPKAVFDAEILHVWSLGVAPYADERFKDYFRHNSFFIGDSTRDAVNRGAADYTPVLLSAVPGLFRRGIVPIDVAMIQTSLPDEHGYVSLGISVDIVRSAVEASRVVIAQVNASMPRVHGETFLSVRDIDFLVPYDEPLLEFDTKVPDDVAKRVGAYVARIVEDGDTLQVGYGSMPNAALSCLFEKKHLGIHTELMTDGIADLMKAGAVDNSRKTLNRGKTVAAFCMGHKATYEFLHDNPTVEFRPVDFTNNPLNIARNHAMTAINSAVEIDLTGQATAESLGKIFFSGMGGQADFMRGAPLSEEGKSILAMQSTAQEESISRIVPFLREGAGVTLTRGDVHYVVTEYGIAYLHGKNIRERAMELITIAHPKFRSWLLEEAKKLNLIYQDQAFVPGEAGEYPEHLETYRTTKSGLNILLRPVKLSDEPLLKDFFYSLSDQTMYRRFVSARKDMPHERLQEFVVIDYTKEMAIVAVVSHENSQEEIVGMGQYGIDGGTLMANFALVVRDAWQGRGVGTEILGHLANLAKKQGLRGFTAEVLEENRAMFHLFESLGLQIERRSSQGIHELRMTFKARDAHEQH
jgi:acyl-CoA hydrolase/RimJ/RimL family protein N-acetyltransferase